MKAIVGRLSDLGLRELLRLLSSAGAEGAVDLDTPAGRGRLWVRREEVAGLLEVPVALSALGRAGTFYFRPEAATADRVWVSGEEFMNRLAAAAEAAARRRAPQSASEVSGTDLLSELRDSLLEVPMPLAAARVGVVAADPRPYRALAAEWHQRGWEVDLHDQPGWPEGVLIDVLIVHLPSSTTLAGRAEPWLALLPRAAGQRPPVPVLWVGGLSDPHLRHAAVMNGVDFMLPAPVGEVGETARWFREEATVLVERLLARRRSAGPSEGEAFREFFVALHADSTLAETHASLLRFAGSFYARGVLFRVRDGGFESLGGFGFAMGAEVRISRGISAFEEAVIGRRPVELDALPAAEIALLLPALGTSSLERAGVFPVLASGECVALFFGDGRLVPEGSTGGLAALLARSGSELLAL
ncbi:MAG: DUF4388 domain-containing protein [Thermoanaerobaculaceae bacterium]|nr:DUF4388 domain-containing protein [Thermoanaerobaculaceae bacterium]MDI9622772.1 DUF4388 domain-containing protein [Acidobacteriota bacterium]NLH12300.1 DUF4388 domain-containing protein [Holophagae bacterium]HPW55345.1 DUF4388 domain-containing protein [Thermoanaerobaculaceae bacterium]